MQRWKFPWFANPGAVLVATITILVCLLQAGAFAGELPVFNLRRASAPPPLVTLLQDPAAASAWYSSSPTWFGTGGKTGDRNHTEVLATYDSTALYIAFMNIDRSGVFHPGEGTNKDLTTVDSNALWIETPAGRRFYLIAAVDTGYPPGPRRASGEFPSYDPKTNALSGWQNSGWRADGMTFQQTIRIPWSALSTTAPAPGSRWRVNFINYNQVSGALTASTVKEHKWAPGARTQPDQWGWLTFDAPLAGGRADVSPEAVLTLRPASGYGDEVTLRAGNAADQGNQWGDGAVIQSNWNDWDPTEHTIKEYLQFDLSLIPRDRKIVAAVLENHLRGNFNSGPSDLFLHVLRLGGAYDPASVTMLTSPLPVENGFRRLVRPSESGNWVSFDVTDTVAKAFDGGAQKVSLALSGSSGDLANGKIWNTSFGPANWYGAARPRLRIMFGKPDVTYNAPLNLGSLNYTSIATTAHKNKFTNGTFRYGTLEGYANTTYWEGPGSFFVDGRNEPFLQMAGDVNPATGQPALRFRTPMAWQYMTQVATGLAGGKTYTVSGWYKGSAPGIGGDLRLYFMNANGHQVGGGYAAYGGSGNWERISITSAAPAGTVAAQVFIYTTGSGGGTHLLLSSFQFEEGTSPTAYSETMGVYYPDYPRSQATTQAVANVANFVTQSVPTQMAAGQTYTATVTMKNMGTSTWTTDKSYRLGTQNPENNGQWGHNRAELPGPVPPGGEVTIPITFKAPLSPGTYDFQWRMVQDGGYWFGDYTPSVAVTVSQSSGVVAGNQAAFVSQSVPSSMVPGLSYPVSVTMKNTGTSTWTAGALYRLGSQCPQDSGGWGQHRVALPHDVAPGQSVTFSFVAQAPLPGQHPFQWQMVQDLKEWFGDKTPNVNVNVSW